VVFNRLACRLSVGSLYAKAGKPSAFIANPTITRTNPRYWWFNGSPLPGLGEGKAWSLRQAGVRATQPRWCHARRYRRDRDSCLAGPGWETALYRGAYLRMIILDSAEPRKRGVPPGVSMRWVPDLRNAAENAATVQQLLLKKIDPLPVFSRGGPCVGGNANRATSSFAPHTAICSSLWCSHAHVDSFDLSSSRIVLICPHQL